MSGKKTGKARRMGSSRKERQGLGRMSHHEDLEAMEEESQAGIEKQDVGRRQVEDSTCASLESRAPYRKPSPSYDLLSTEELHQSHSAVKIGLKSAPVSVAPESRTSGFGEQVLGCTLEKNAQSQTKWPPDLQSTTPPPLNSAEQSMTTEEIVITAKITHADVTQVELPTHEDSRSTYPTTVLNTRLPEDLSNPESHSMERRRKMGSSRRSSHKSDVWRRGGVEWDVADSCGENDGQEKTEKKVIETSEKLQEEKVPKWITSRAEGHYGHDEEGKEEPALVEDMHAAQPSYITERQIPSPYSEFQAQSMYTELDRHSSPSQAAFESDLTGNPDHLKDRMLDSDPPGGAVLLRNPQSILFPTESGDHVNPVLQHHQPSHRCLPDETGHAVGGFEQKKRRMASTRKTGCSLHKEKDIGAELGDFSEEVLADLNEILRASRGLQDIGNIEDSEKHRETDMSLIKNIDTVEGNEREMPSPEENNDIKETKKGSPAEENETKEIKQEGLGKEKELQVLKDEGPLEHNAMHESKEEDLVDSETHELKEEGGLVEQNKTQKLIKESLVEENDIQVLKEQGPKKDDKIQILMGQGGEKNNQSVKRDKDILDQDVLEDEETSKAVLEMKEEKEGDAEEVKVLNEKVSVKLFGGQEENIKLDQSVLGSSSVDGYQEEKKSEEKDCRSWVIHQAQGETLTAVPEIKISPLFELTASQNLELTLSFDHTLDNHSENSERTSTGNEPMSHTSEPPCTEKFIMEDRQPTPGKRRKIGSTRKNTRRKGDQVEEDRPEKATQHKDDEGGIKEEVRNEALDEHTGVEVMTELYRGEVQLDKQLIKKEKEEEHPENRPKMGHEGEVIIKEEIDVSAEKTMTISCEIFGPQATEYSLDVGSLASFQSKAEDSVTIEEISTNIMLEESSKILDDISDRECSGMNKRRKMGSSRRGGREQKKWQEEEDRRHLEHADSQDERGAEGTMEVRENIVEAETERIEENVKLAMAEMVVESSECGPDTIEKVEEKWEKSGEEERGSLEFSGPTFTENNKDADVNSLNTCQGLTDNSTAAGSSTSNLPVLQSSQQHEDSSPQVTSSMGKRRKMGSSRKGTKEWHKEQESEKKTVLAEQDRKAKKEEFAKEGYMTEVLILAKEEQRGETRTEERNLMEKPTLSVRSIPDTTSQMVESSTMPRQPELPNLQGTALQTARRRKMGSSRKDKTNLGKGERELEWTKDTAMEEDPDVAAVLQRIQEVFSHSTFKDKEFITLEDIQDLSSELGPCVEELQQVFQQLDRNLRGLVTPEDFTIGLREFFQSKTCPPNLIHRSQASVGLGEMDHRPRQYFLPHLEHPGGHSFQQGPAGALGYSTLGWTSSRGTLPTEENPVPRLVSLSQGSNHWLEGQALWDRKADEANNEETGSLSKHQESGRKQGVEQLREEPGLLSKDQETVQQNFEEHLKEEPVTLGEGQGGLRQLWPEKGAETGKNEGGQNKGDLEGEKGNLTGDRKEDTVGEKEDWKANPLKGGERREEQCLIREEGIDKRTGEGGEERNKKMMVQDEKIEAWLVQDREGREEQVIKRGGQKDEWNIAGQRRMEQTADGREEREEIVVKEGEEKEEQVMDRGEEKKEKFKVEHGEEREELVEGCEENEKDFKMNRGEEKEKGLKEGAEKKDKQVEETCEETDEQVVQRGEEEEQAMEGGDNREKQLVEECEERKEGVAESGEESIEQVEETAGSEEFLKVKGGEDREEQIVKEDAEDEHLEEESKAREKQVVERVEREKFKVEGVEEKDQQLVEDEKQVKKKERADVNERSKQSKEQTVEGDEEIAEQVLERGEEKEEQVVERFKEQKEQVVRGGEENEEQVVQAGEEREEKVQRDEGEEEHAVETVENEEMFNVKGGEEREEQIVGGGEEKDEKAVEGGEEGGEQVVDGDEESEEQVLQGGEERREQVVEGGEERKEQFVEEGEEQEEKVVEGDEERDEQVVKRIKREDLKVEGVEEKEKQLVDGGEEKDEQTVEGDEEIAEQVLERGEEKEEQVVERFKEQKEQVVRGGEENEEQVVQAGEEREEKVLEEETEQEQLEGGSTEREKRVVERTEREGFKVEVIKEKEENLVEGGEESEEQVVERGEERKKLFVEEGEEQEGKVVEGDEERDEQVVKRIKREEFKVEGGEEREEHVVDRIEREDLKVEGVEEKEQLVDGAEENEEQVVQRGEEREEKVVEGQTEQEQLEEGSTEREKQVMDRREREGFKVEVTEEQEEESVEGGEDSEEQVVEGSKKQKEQVVEGGEERKEQFVEEGEEQEEKVVEGDEERDEQVVKRIKMEELKVEGGEEREEQVVERIRREDLKVEGVEKEQSVEGAEQKDEQVVQGDEERKEQVVKQIKREELKVEGGEEREEQVVERIKREDLKVEGVEDKEQLVEGAEQKDEQVVQGGEEREGQTEQEQLEEGSTEREKQVMDRREREGFKVEVTEVQEEELVEGGEESEEQVVQGGKKQKEQVVEGGEERKEQFVEEGEEQEEKVVEGDKERDEQVVKRIKREDLKVEGVEEKEKQLVDGGEEKDEQAVEGGEEGGEQVVDGDDGNGKQVEQGGVQTKEQVEEGKQGEEQVVEGDEERDEQVVMRIKREELKVEGGEEKKEQAVERGEGEEEHVVETVENEEMFNMKGGEEREEQIVGGGEEKDEKAVEGGEEEGEQVVDGDEESEEQVLQGGEERREQVVEGGEESEEQVVKRIKREVLKVEGGEEREEQVVQGGKKQKEQVVEGGKKGEMQLVEKCEEREEQVVAGGEWEEEQIVERVETEQLLKVKGSEEKDEQVVKRCKEQKERAVQTGEESEEKVLEEETEQEQLEGGSTERENRVVERTEREGFKVEEIKEKEENLVEGGEESEEQVVEGGEKGGEQVLDVDEEKKEQVVQGSEERKEQFVEEGEEREEKVVEGDEETDEQVVKRIKREELKVEGGKEREEPVVERIEREDLKVEGVQEKEQLVEGDEENEEQVVQGDEERKEQVVKGVKREEVKLDGCKEREEQVIVGGEEKEERVVERQKEAEVEQEKQVVEGCGENGKDLKVEGVEEKEEQFLEGDGERKEQVGNGVTREEVKLDGCGEREEHVVEGGEEKEDQLEYASQAMETNQMEVPLTDSRWLCNTWELQQIVHLGDTLKDLRSIGRYQEDDSPPKSTNSVEDHEWIWHSELLGKQRSFSVEEEEVQSWDVWTEIGGDGLEWRAQREGREQEAEMVGEDVLYWEGWKEERGQREITHLLAEDLYPILEENEAESELAEDNQKGDWDASHSQLKTDQHKIYKSYDIENEFVLLEFGSLGSEVTGILEDAEENGQVQRIENEKDGARGTNQEGQKKPVKAEAEQKMQKIEAKDEEYSRGEEGELGKSKEQHTEIGNTQEQQDQKKWETSEGDFPRINREEESRGAVKERELIKVIHPEVQEEDNQESRERDGKEKTSSKMEAEDWVAEMVLEEEKKKDKGLRKKELDVILEVDKVELEKPVGEAKAEEKEQKKQLERDRVDGTEKINKIQFNKEERETERERSTTEDVLIERCEEKNVVLREISQTLMKESITQSHEILQENQQSKAEITEDDHSEINGKTGENNDLNTASTEESKRGHLGEENLQLEEIPLQRKMKWVWGMERKGLEYVKVEREEGMGEEYGEAKEEEMHVRRRETGEEGIALGCRETEEEAMGSGYGETKEEEEMGINYIQSEEAEEELKNPGLAEQVDWLNLPENVFTECVSEVPDESRANSEAQCAQSKQEAAEVLTITEARDQESFVFNAVVGSDGALAVYQDAENRTAYEDSWKVETCEKELDLQERVPCSEPAFKEKKWKDTEVARMEDKFEDSLSESHVLLRKDDIENKLADNKRRNKACDTGSQVEKQVVECEDIAPVKIINMKKVDETFNSETEKDKSVEQQITRKYKMCQEGEKLEQVNGRDRKTSEEVREDEELRGAAMQIFEEIEQEIRQELMEVREAQQRVGEEKTSRSFVATGEGSSMALHGDGQRALGYLPAGEWSPPASGPDVLYNVVLVGNSSVGKTSFMKRLQSGEVNMDHCATIGLDSCIQAMMMDGQRVLLQLWDTAGQERYHSITKQILRKAQGLLLMYDITSSESFCGLRYWMSCAEEGAPHDVVMMLLGNKNDSPKREVPRDEGERLAAEFSIPFMECSAASGDNVTHSMETLARMLKQRLDQKDEPPLMLHKEQPKKRFGCC